MIVSPIVDVKNHFHLVLDIIRKRAEALLKNTVSVAQDRAAPALWWAAKAENPRYSRLEVCARPVPRPR